MHMRVPAATKARWVRESRAAGMRLTDWAIQRVEAHPMHKNPISIPEGMTPADFRAWHEAMGYTYDTGSAALGVSRGTYADWLAGRSRTTGKPIKISKLVALACAALAAGVEEWARPELPDQ